MPGISQASEEAGAPAAALTADLFATRFLAMFSADASGPIAVRTPLLASVVTKKHVKLAWAVVGDHQMIPDGTIRALSAAFGNFDRITALGWVLGDAAGRPLLERKQAYDIGLKARRAAVNVKV